MPRTRERNGWGCHEWKRLSLFMKLFCTGGPTRLKGGSPYGPVGRFAHGVIESLSLSCGRPTVEAITVRVVTAAGLRTSRFRIVS
jgi:hypothetical protein